jgi:hypothetical protein
MSERTAVSVKNQEKFMNRKGLRFALVFATVLCIIGLFSCARDQQLVSITIQPDAQGFLAPDPSLMLN